MTDLAQERKQAHAYLDQLPPEQLSAIRGLLESMLDPVTRALTNAPTEDEETSEEEKRAVRQSREWFEHNEGTAFEDVVAECGFTMDQIRDYKDPT